MDQPFIGMLACFGFNYAPVNWSKCEGQIVAIAQHQALFSLIGTFYGGDGRTSLGLPDLRGRTPIGYGQGPGLTNYPIGNKVGTETHTLTTQQMPSHSHTATFQGSGTAVMQIEVSTSAATKGIPAAGDYLGGGGLSPAQPIYVPNGSEGTTVELGGASASGSISGDIDVQSTGDGASFAILQPLLVTNWCIAMTGLFPPRN